MGSTKEKLNKEIIEKLELLQTNEDLIDLFNFVGQEIYGGSKEMFQLKHLTYYANPKLSIHRYKTFQIRKKSGKERIIHAPAPGLRSILRVFAFILEAVYTPNPNVMGFTAKRSIVDNAKTHLNKDYVYNIDLADFFHSFDRNRVKIGIWYYLFNLDKSQEKIAFILAALVTHPIEINGEIRTVLPQGSPTSPILTNILCQFLDRKLNGMARRFRVNYTRYADDITFSSNFNVYRKTEFQIELYKIIEEGQELKINPKKTRLQKRGYRQEVTGVIVNNKANVYRKYVKQLRMWIYYMEKYGLLKAEQLFKKDYIKHKGHVKFHGNPMFNVIMGKLQYLKMVKGSQDSTYISLKNRFEKELGIENEVDQILNIWETEGIEKAMEQFKDIAHG